MKTATSKFRKLSRAILALLATQVIVLTTIPVHAQNCAGLPAVPTSSITVTQDRDQMMCQQGLTYPTLPVRSGTAWPWNDPTAPTNARPATLSTPEGNWTDPQGHVVVRTNWGLWHTYDADSIYEPSPSQHYNPGSTTWPFPSLNGGALSGAGDYGPESNPRYTDIELLKMKDGTPVSSPEDWWTKRRPEIFNLVQQELYGKTIDPTIPVTWTVVNNASGNQVVGGVTYPYRQKTFTGTVDKSSYPALRNTPIITAQCRFPAATGKKYPVVVTYGEGTGIFQYTAPYGIGTCSYTPTGVQPDSGGAALSSYIIGLVNKGNWRKPDDPGSLVAWAWGVSRLVDRFATDPDFDADKVGVEGHSRYGKATLVTAAYDDRIVVAWPSDGGALGTALARRHYGETLEFVSSSTSEYHWVNGNIMKYGGRLNPATQFPRRLELLDVDAHSTTSLVAPRAIFVTNGTDTPAGVGDAWADPRGCFLSGKLASPVWQMLGWTGQIIPPGTVFTSPGSPGNGVLAGPAESPGGTPPFNVAFIQGTVGWRRQQEGHTPTPNWPTFALFSSRYLNDKRPVVTPGQSFTVPDWPSTAVGTAVATDGDAADTLQSWQVTGGTGAYKFQINPATGQITVDRSILDGSAHSYTLALIVGDGKVPSHVQNVTINVPADTTAPVPDVASLPTVTGECSAGISGPPPTATDAYVGSVTATTSDPLSYSDQGEHTVTWLYNDGHGNISTQTQKVIVKDVTAPVPSLGSLPTVTGECSASISSAPTAMDNCAGMLIGTTTDPLSYITQGTFTVHWTFNDGHGNQSTQTQTVVVHDTIAPTIQSLTASPNVLWPPNHQMIPVNVSALVNDACDSSPVTRIIAVESNEPVNGNGDGDTAPDWAVTGNLTLNLRAERAGGGSGRVYTITVESRDASGNVSVKQVAVSVPHNQ
jgi:hypothetical protein